MGITGLLPLLDKCTRPCHISEFRGGTVAVDTYCWLHKGATSCAEQLAKGQQTDMYVTYCLKYVKLLLSYDIHPIMVFDGRNLPAKLDTELKRRQLRSNAKQRAAELLCLGKNDEARTYLKQCIDITPQMANALMKECRKLNVDCIVAPYESDAQLAFFNLKGVADAVITEDSDLVLFGCNKVVYKMDIVGSGQLVESEKLYLAMNMRPDQFTFDKFRYMCILSGCDYVDSLPGIGLKKALKFVSMTAETNPEIFLDRVPRYLNMRHLNISQEYKEKFLVALATFKHQTVFDPFKRRLVPLTDPEVHGTNPEHCKNAGEIFDDTKALQVALGNLHPNTFEKIDDWQPPILEAFVTGSHSIWSGCYVKRTSRKSSIASSSIKQSIEKKGSVESEVKTQHLRKMEHLSIDDEERAKLEYDLKFERELEYYVTKKEDTVVKIETVESQIVEKKESVHRTSPVLSRNPFLVKKKLSKFQNTVIEGSTIVKSRFFSSSSEQTVTITKSPTTVDDNSSCDDDTQVFNSSQKENQCQENVEGTVVLKTDEICKYRNDSSTSSTLHIPYSKKRLSEDNDDSESKDDLGPSCTEEERAEEPRRSLETTLKQPQSEPKRRKTGPCRRLGLSKPKSQPTLLHMFDKLKKDV